MIQETEVKLLLSSERALEDKLPSEELRALFGFAQQAEPMLVWYLDTPTQKLKEADWSVRYRQRKTGGLELTYKKRYSEQAYAVMLQTPLSDAFHADFTPEIDLGYSKKTCSLSCIKTFEPYDSLDDLEARRLAILNCPPPLTDWGGKNQGFRHLCEAVLFGPLTADKYKGKYEDITIKLEIWPLDSYLTELSFDIETHKSEEAKSRVIQVLEQHGLLLHDNTLKTDAMLRFFGKG